MKLKTTFSAPILGALVLLLLIASRFLELETLSLQENICLAIIVLQVIILIVPSAFYVKIRGEGFSKRLRFAPIGIEKLLVTLLAALTLILGDTLMKLILYHIGYTESSHSVYSYYIGTADPGVIYTLVTFAILPAIAEELLFRGIFCAEYESEGALTAVIASAGLYGMFSLSFGRFPIYFFAGLIFALVMYLTRSIFASMICHLCYALFDLAAGPTVHTIITKEQSTGFLIFVLAGLFLLCLASLFAECERIYYGYSLADTPSEYANPKANLRTFAQALLAPPYLIVLAVFVVAAVQFG
ncbi:MAG: CPBP family intramembrane metalloprotease [Ruminococcaceae bacterium]|nr:CPBP family intramembrane metalloprotease [Oscillospiraceae bacterium]